MSKYVLVYTMEKVGSSTIKRAVESVGLVVGRAYARNIDSIDLSEYFAVVAVARDPVARNLSAFLEFRDDYYDEFPTEYSPEMLEKFLDEFPHDEPDEWFDAQIVPHFDIDIYAESFPKTKGWKVYDERLLVIKTEALNRALEQALREFLSVDEGVAIDVQHRGMGIKKHRAASPVYAELLKNAKFDADFLDRMYSTRYVKHFYLASEVKKFRNRWTAK